MGGYGSGRPRSRTYIEDGLTLDLPKLIRDDMVRPGRWSGSLVWRNTTTGEKVGSMGYTAIVSADGGTGAMRLDYSVPNTRDGCVPIVEHVPLEGLPQPFGGWMWYFRCPLSHRRCRKLVLPPGARRFAARQAYRLSYRSQSEAPYDRALSQAFKIRRRLGGAEGVGLPVDRPSGLHQRTFDGEIARLKRYEAICDRRMLQLVERLDR